MDLNEVLANLNETCPDIKFNNKKKKWKQSV